MRYLFVLLALLFSGACNLAMCQFEVDFNPYRPVNDTIRFNDNESMFRKTLNREFGRLVTGQARNSIGNFASVDITDAKVAFGASSIFNNGSVLTGKVSGGISDGFFSIFNNSRLNTNISVEAQYNVMSWHRKMLITNVDSEYVYNLGLEKIRYEYEAKRLTVVHRRDSLALYKKLESKVADSSRLAKLIEGAKGPQKDSLEFELGKTRILLDSIQVAIAMLPSALEDLHVLHDKTVKRLDAMTLESAVEGFKFSWFSFGGKVTNNSFTYFNPALPFASQKIDTSFVSYEARIQFSSYRYSPVSYRSLFFDIGLAFGYSDNFDKLKKREISETTEYGTTPGVRSVTRKSNAYQGEYRRDLKKLTIYEDWYQFLFNDNTGAIHVNPEWIMQNEEKPIANLQVGFLMAFKNTKKDAPVVNAELYYKFNDLFKTTDTDYKLFERNNIGIRFTFPIQFKTQID